MPKHLDVVVSTVNSELRFSIDRKALGRELFELVAKTLGIREVTYFGLSYVDEKGYKAWLKDDKRLIDQDLPKESCIILRFRIMFYPEDVGCELVQEVTSHIFFLEVKDKILSQDLYCPPETAMMMAAYAVQAQHGDYDETIHTPGCISIESLLPQRVLNQFNMTPDMWENAIKQCWSENHCRLARDEAEMEYLKLAQDLDMYGITYFDIKNKKGTGLKLGVDAHGINIYESADVLTPKITFPWNEVRNVVAKDKKFVIKPLDKQSPDFVVYVSESRINKLIFQLSVGNHERFNKRREPDSMETQQMKAQAAEEHLLRQAERERLQKETEARLTAEEEREELERRLQEYEGMLRQANDTLRRKEQEAQMLVERVKEAEEQAQRLARKARRAEEAVHKAQQQAAHKNDEDKGRMAQKAAEAEELARKALFNNSEDSSFMGDPLPYQLKDARTAEQYAKWRMMELSSSTTQTHTHDHHSSSGEEFNPRPGAMLTYEAPSTKFPVLEQNGAQLHQLQTSGPHHRGYADSPAHPQGQVPQNGAVQMPPMASQGLTAYPMRPPPTYQFVGNGALTSGGRVQHQQPVVPRGSGLGGSMGSPHEHDLSLDSSQQSQGYGRSRYMGHELDALRMKMEGLKMENRRTHNDILYEERSRHGGDKYSVQQQTRSRSPNARISFMEKL